MGAGRRRRLDVELVRRGLASSREQARRLIEAHVVTVNGAVAERPARLVDPGDALEVRRPPRFVSRGGEKLDGALDALGLEVTGRRCIDVGASTGGFTDCLLQRGAAAVVAIDVGRAQLHERLGASPQVHNLEGVNVRHLHPEDAGGPADLVTSDLSFISLRLVMDRLAALTAPGGNLIALVKPQFEAGRAEASKGRGVIRSPEIWRRVLTEVAAAAAGEGLAPQAVVLADPPGPAGNAEFFLHCRRPAEPPPVPPAAGDSRFAEHPDYPDYRERPGAAESRSVPPAAADPRFAEHPDYPDYRERPGAAESRSVPPAAADPRFAASFEAAVQAATRRALV